MKILNSDLDAAFQKEILRYFHMVEFVFTDTYRFNNSDNTVADTDGNLYTSRGFEFDDIGLSVGLAVDDFSITIDDTDQLFSALLLSEDVRNKVVRFYYGAVVQDNITGIQWDDSLAWDSGDIIWQNDYAKTSVVAQEFIRGIVSSWELSGDNVCKISVKNELVLWSKRVLRRCQGSCQWVFGGTECQYAGTETWCDQSYDRCTDLANTDNYGGFRFLPSLMNKEIWWGRSPGYSD